MKLEYYVIHCTATKEFIEVTSEDIKRWHCSPKPEGNGWSQVGYTEMWHLNGDEEQLVPNNGDDIVDQWEITNGAKGYNSKSRHGVYVGGMNAYGNPKDTRTEAQEESMRRFILQLKKDHPNIKIIGHNEISSKACPSFDVQEWLKEIGAENDSDT